MLNLINNNKKGHMKKTLIKTILIPTMALMLTNCAGNYTPVTDNKGVDKLKYEKDLQECQAIAKEQAGAGKGAVVGAIAGMFVGAVVSAVVDPDGVTGDYGTRVGTVYGAGAGAVAGAEQQITIIKNCMSGRGHKVLY